MQKSVKDGNFILAVRRHQVEKEDRRVGQKIKEIVTSVSHKYYKHTPELRRQHAEECVQAVWVKLCKGARDKAKQATCPEAYLTTVIERAAHRYFRKVLAIGPRHKARRERPVLFNSTKLNEVIECLEYVTTGCAESGSEVDLQDFLDEANCPDDVRKYLKSKVGGNAVTDEQIQERNGWTRSYLADIKTQARDLLQTTWPDEVARLVAAPPPKREDTGSPPVVERASGNFTFAEMREQLRVDQDTRLGASCLFLQERGDWFAWGPVVEELSQAIGRATEYGPCLRLDSDKEDVMQAVFACVARYEEGARSPEPPAPLFIWSYA